MRKLLLVAAALTGLGALVPLDASAAPPRLSPDSHLVPPHAGVTNVDYRWNHHSYHHRHWDHGHWRYY